ncbi:STAS domain-containing protein [Streptosporangium sp. CA-135522]|uniref:STAS domain-containing protein n=1 Tax=Streptosporangium sp. CA-135522 TaxID=3240072 RepID=UPI003D92EEFF
MTSATDRDPAFAVSAGLHDDAIIVRPAGELDLASTPILRAQLERIWALPDVAVLIMDLSEVTFCDSTGLAVLIATLRRSRERGARLMLAGITGMLVRLLALTGLRDAFAIYPDVTEALRAAAGRSADHSAEPHNPAS